MKAKFFGWLIATLIRAVGITLRWRIEDRCGVLTDPSKSSVIWGFWHNRVFVMPLVYRRYLWFRKGAVLTSPSGDGELSVEVMRRFGVDAVRGSSNRSPIAALRRMLDYLKDKNGLDIAITPDGPRGPVHVLQPGIIKLAQLTGFPVIPITLKYSSSVTLKTWDGFQIPFPFAKVNVVLNEFEMFPTTKDRDEFESMRVRLEKVLKSAP